MNKYDKDNYDKDNVVERATMQEVVVKKAELLAKLKENRDSHRDLFIQALAGYHARCVEILKEHIARIEAGKVERVMISLPVPEDHTDDYERAIATLDWTILDEVELSISEFDRYVRDNWTWKNEFITTSAMYNNVG